METFEIWLVAEIRRSPVDMVNIPLLSIIYRVFAPSQVVITGFLPSTVGIDSLGIDHSDSAYSLRLSPGTRRSTQLKQTLGTFQDSMKLSFLQEIMVHFSKVYRHRLHPYDYDDLSMYWIKALLLVFVRGCPKQETEVNEGLLLFTIFFSCSQTCAGVAELSIPAKCEVFLVFTASRLLQDTSRTLKHLGT